MHDSSTDSEHPLGRKHQTSVKEEQDGLPVEYQSMLNYIVGELGPIQIQRRQRDLHAVRVAGGADQQGGVDLAAGYDVISHDWGWQQVQPR